MRIGFVGAGSIGQGLTRLATAAGCDVMLSNSRGPESLKHVAEDLGVGVGTVEEAVRAADIVVLTVPLGRVEEIDPAPFQGRVVLDTCNYYPARDGRIDPLEKYEVTTSELVQAHLSGASIVKAFNAIMAGDLVPPFGLPGGRRALPVAGDSESSAAAAIDLHRLLGFDTVLEGDLSESWRFERAKPAYCIPLDRQGLISALAAAERAVELPHNSWKRMESPDEGIRHAAGR